MENSMDRELFTGLMGQLHIRVNLLMESLREKNDSPFKHKINSQGRIYKHNQ
jgi:hypothetical protein